MGKGGLWGGWLRCCLRQWQGRCWRRARRAGPDQNPATFIDCQLQRLDDFGLQILKICLIQIELALQCPIGDPLMLLEEFQDPLEYVIEVHHHSSLPIGWSHALRCGLCNCLSYIARIPDRGKWERHGATRQSHRAGCRIRAG